MYLVAISEVSGIEMGLAKVSLELYGCTISNNSTCTCGQTTVLPMSFHILLEGTGGPAFWPSVSA